MAKRLQLPFKGRKVYRHDLSDLFVIHLHVLMRHNIPHVFGISPWNMRKPCLRTLGNHVRRLADNHDVPFCDGFLVIIRQKIIL